MTDKLTIKPTHPRVLDPATRQALPTDTESRVPRNRYWLRRLRDGDVVEVSAPKTADSPKKSAPKKGEKE